MKKFDVEYQFDFYLRQVKLDKHKMPVDQIREIKQAFIAGLSSMLVLNTEIGKMDYKQSKPVIEKLWAQCCEFWNQKLADRKTPDS